MTNDFLSKRAALKAFAALCASPFVPAFLSSASASPYKKPPMPFPPTLAGELDNVIKGWTADGQFSDAAPVPFPADKGARTEALTVTWYLIASYLGHTPEARIDDAIRTGIIRKILAHLRGGPHPETFTFTMTGSYLIRNPAAALTDMTLADMCAQRHFDIASAREEYRKAISNWPSPGTPA